MAETGYNWSALAHLTYNTGTDIDGIAVADAGVLTADALDLDGKAACQVSVTVVEDNSGACDGDVYISVLQSDLDPDSEGWQAGPTTGPVYTDAVWSTIIDPVQNTTRKTTFSIDPSQISHPKIHVLNDGGQELAVTVNYRTATIPAAS